MQYGNIIRRALEITWRRKALWIYGIAIALFGGVPGIGAGYRGGGIQYSLNPEDLTRWGQRIPLLPFGRLGWADVAPFIAGLAALGVIVAIIVYLLGLIVRNTSDAALIAMVDEVETAGETSFQSGLNRGWQRFLHLLAIRILLGIVSLIVAIPLVLVAILTLALVIGPAVALFTTGEGGGIAFGILWLVFAGLIWLAAAVVVAAIVGGAFTLVRELSFRAVVLDVSNVFTAIGDGLRLIRRHLGRVVVIWLILLAINVAIGLILAPLAMVGAGGIAGLLAALAGATRSGAVVLLLATPVIILLALLAIAVSGIYYTFVSTVWTLTYREITSVPAAISPSEPLVVPPAEGI
jgi:hypothetical protein